MSYKLKVLERDVFGKGKYVNSSGNTECAEFARQVTDAPATTAWKIGTKISDAKPGEVLRGTAIATFDTNKRYPRDGKRQARGNLSATRCRANVGIGSMERPG